MSDLCRHFGACGGCASQDIPSTDYIAAKRAGVVTALARAGVDAVVNAPLAVPPASRRRAILKLGKANGVLQIGFHAAASHTIIDMSQCLVLTPGLFDLAQKLRPRLSPLFHDGEKADLHVTECDNGFDCALRWSRKPSSDLVAAMAKAVGGFSIVRLVLNSDVLLEDATPIVNFDGLTVKPPPYAFLQPTRPGEVALQAQVASLLAKARHVADLFSGCGTFSLPLARGARVHAVEQEAGLLAALVAGARGAKGLKPVTTEVRDLFKLPLTPLELKDFDGVALDPPRAGAEAQARALGRSKVGRIAYVSCDAASFARDAKILVEAGFTLGPVTPIDQFLWSSHIELVAGFSRS